MSASFAFIFAACVACGEDSTPDPVPVVSRQDATPDPMPVSGRKTVTPTVPTFTVVNRTKAPEVARAKAATFRNGDWHTGHDCPSCGRQQLVIYAGGKYGPHTHRCPVDGTVWRH